MGEEEDLALQLLHGEADCFFQEADAAGEEALVDLLPAEALETAVEVGQGEGDRLSHRRVEGLEEVDASAEKGLPSDPCYQSQEIGVGRRG